MVPPSDQLVPALPATDQPRVYLAPPADQLLVDEVHEADQEAVNEREERESCQQGGPSQAPSEVSEGPSLEEERPGHLIRFSRRLKEKAKSAEQAVLEQRRLAKATQSNRHDKFQN